MARGRSLQIYRSLMTAMRLILPLYLARRVKAGKEDPARLSERYGKDYCERPQTDHLIWLHAVSVGEVTGALALAKALSKAQANANKNCHFVITTGTTTAAQTIAAKAGDLPVIHAFAPFDAPRYVDRFFDHFQPSCGIILESDFWPCLLGTAHKRQIPIFCASAQISAQSADMWQKMPQLAHDIFAPIRCAFTHDETQAAQFAALGLANTIVTGSLKLPAIPSAKTDHAKALSKAAKGRLVLVAASTHAGEEPQILTISAYLRDLNVPHLLIIAPRHPERGDEIATFCPSAKRRSQGALPDDQDTIYLNDQLGDMPSLYQAANIVWLGATFSGKGGHNPLEPASYGVPIICGPSQFKNQYEFDQLSNLGVCLQQSDSRTSAQLIASLWADKDRCQQISKAGKAYAATARKRPQTVSKAILSALAGEL